MRGPVILEADPEEVAGAVPIEPLLVAVCQAMAVNPAEILTILGTDPCRIKVASGSELEGIAKMLGSITGFGCPDRVRGLFLPPRLILVIRLDWRHLLAHELAHLVRHIAGGGPNEGEACRVEDAV